MSSAYVATYHIILGFFSSVLQRQQLIYVLVELSTIPAQFVLCDIDLALMHQPTLLLGIY